MTIARFVRSIAAALVAAGTILANWSGGADAAGQAYDFTDFSLEDLTEAEVVSVSKRQEEVGSAAAAVHVITADNLKRSGVTTIAEALRMVPGMEVARINTHTWAITARGSNSRFANKLLVLIDGRSVYTPLFSGVFWDRQDTLLEDIERIEVIRGPGASLWGANAVNGVVNIITKSASATQGNLVSLGAGNEEQGPAAFRHGGTIGGSGFYRVFAKAFRRDGGALANGEDGKDDWEAGRGGFRMDLNSSNGDVWHFQGEMFSSENGEEFAVPRLTAPFSEDRAEDTEVFGAYALARWKRVLGKGNEITGQFYFDHNRFNDIRVSQRRNTADLSVEQELSPWPDHTIVWGAGYRHLWDGIDDGEGISFSESNESTGILSVFAQDSITFGDPSLTLTLGSKFEINEYTGFEVQPTARLAWQAGSTTTFWTAVSRAVRTPSRAENHVRLDQTVIPPFTPDNPGPLPTVVRIFGNEGVEAERLVSLEAGTRFRPFEFLSLDIATYYNFYEDLIGVVEGTPFVEGAHLVVPLTLENLGSAQAYGLEALATWHLGPNWRVQTTYSLLESDDPQIDGNSPRHQFQIRSLANLSDRIRFDAGLRFVDELEALGVDSYFSLDARFAYQVDDRTEISVVGRNLLAPDHFEFASEATLPSVPTQAERAFFVTFERRF